MALPQFQSELDQLNMMQNKWAAQLDPLLRAPLSNGQILTSISLVSGDNQVNHKLGRKLQGWIIIRLRAAATVYDKQDANGQPALTLALNASAPVIVDLFVF